MEERGTATSEWPARVLRVVQQRGGRCRSCPSSGRRGGPGAVASAMHACRRRARAESTDRPLSPVAVSLSHQPRAHVTAIRLCDAARARVLALLPAGVVVQARRYRRSVYKRPRRCRLRARFSQADLTGREVRQDDVETRAALIDGTAREQVKELLANRQPRGSVCQIRPYCTIRHLVCSDWLKIRQLQKLPVYGGN